MTVLVARADRSTILMVCAAAAFMLIAAAAIRFPYGYYTLLRLVVALSAGLMTWKSVMANSVLLRVVGMLFGLVCLLYNPIIIVHLTRGDWLPLNMLTAALFGIGGFIWRPVATGKS